MHRVFTLTLLFFVALHAYAQVEITEVMYDLEGADNPHEWIEAYNNGSEDLDLSNWRFNDGSNHKLVISEDKGGQGSLILPPSSYLILADSAKDFLLEHDGFSGTVIDTVMSLGNTSETIQIKNAEGLVVSEFSYTSDMGASGDGNSLQKINNSWSAYYPSPGKENVFSNSDEFHDGANDDEEVNINDGLFDNSVYEPAIEPKIIAYAGTRKRVSVVGARVLFEGSVYTTDNDEIDGARYIWNFGDGTSGGSKKNEHIYYYPGEYAVVLDVASGVYAATDRIRVIVSPADIIISDVGEKKDFFIEVKNNTKYELDLSGWKLQSGNNIFIFPKDTYILSKKSVRIAPSVTKFSFNKDVSLLYPNNNIVYVYKEKEIVIKSTDVKIPVVQKDRNLFVDNLVTVNDADDEISSASLIIKETVDIPEEIQKTREGGFIQTASVQEAVNTTKNKKEDNLFWGLIGVSLIALVSVYVVLDSKSVQYVPGIKSEADLYKIIEIDSD